MIPEGKLKIPHYFTAAVKKQIGELYASAGIANLALAMVGIFEPIFLYHVIRLSVPDILLFYGAVYFVFMVGAIWGGKLATRYGYAHAILFSIPFQVLYWIFLYSGQNYHFLIWIAPLLYGIEKSLYWPAFDASLARFADEGQRGREYSVMYAIISLVGIVGPFLGGLISQHFGVRLAFIVASAVYVCSFIPLFVQKEEFVPKAYSYRDTWNLLKQYPKTFLAFTGYGEEMILLNIWPIFLYIVVANYEKVGTLVTVATLIASALAIYIGKVSDQYRKQFLIKIGSFFYFLFWLFRFLALTPYTAFTADALSRTGKDMVEIPFNTLMYERAHEIHIMRYIVMYEQALSLGKITASLIGAIAFEITVKTLGFSLVDGFMVLFVMAGLFSLLYVLL